ncbi:MAG: hypothetical protein MZV49_08320 [Rhodopseudomonas palustris]|nr:hypothetical protein [Rhodopseudomonas palustris]
MRGDLVAALLGKRPCKRAKRQFDALDAVNGQRRSLSDLAIRAGAGSQSTIERHDEGVLRRDIGHRAHDAAMRAPKLRPDTRNDNGAARCPAPLSR